MPNQPAVLNLQCVVDRVEEEERGVGVTNGVFS